MSYLPIEVISAANQPGKLMDGDGLHLTVTQNRSKRWVHRFMFQKAGVIVIINVEYLIPACAPHQTCSLEIPISVLASETRQFSSAAI